MALKAAQSWQSQTFKAKAQIKKLETKIKELEVKIQEVEEEHHKLGKFMEQGPADDEEIKQTKKRLPEEVPPLHW